MKAIISSTVYELPNLFIFNVHQLRHLNGIEESVISTFAETNNVPFLNYEDLRVNDLQAFASLELDDE